MDEEEHFNFIFETSKNSDKSDDEENKDERWVEKTCIPGHLASPINGEEVELLLNGDKKTLQCGRHRKLKKTFFDCKSFKELKDPLGTAEEWFVNNFDVSESSVRKRKELILKTMLNWKLHKLNYVSTLTDDMREKIRDRIETTMVRITEEFDTLIVDFKNMMAIEKIKDKICFKEIIRGETINFIGGKFERDLSSLPINNQNYLFPTTLILCALDKIQSLFWLKLYWLISDINKKYPGRSILETGVNIYTYLKELRKVGGQDFFSFVASWESLMVGWTVRLPDDLGFTKLYDTQEREMKEFLNKYAPDKNLSPLLPPTTFQVDVTMYLELTGMAKILGYPTLESARLLDQLKEYGTKGAKNVDLDIITKVEGKLVRNMCLEFRKKHKKYPKFKTVPYKLQKYLLKNKLVTNNELFHDLSLWAEVDFDKSIDFDYSPDLSEITKDSAAAITFSEYPTMYDKCAYAHLYGKKPPEYVNGKKVGKSKNVHRRIIDAYLKADEQLVRKLIEKRERGEWDKEDHVVVQCGKELEQKPYVGRAFTKQTPNQRYLQVILESNIATGIFPYVKNQTMTSSELQIATQLLTQIKMMGETAVFVCFDLKKWCLHQRIILTYIAAKRYDQLFGFKGLFKSAHDFYLDPNIFCNSRFSPPDYDSNGIPIPGPFFMNKFIGGFEGMCQKAWTHVTGCILELALEMCGLEGYVLGQGDNQVVILRMPSGLTKEEMEVKRKAFLRTCEALFRSVNHEVKSSETWYSKNLHEYGKQRVYKGETISQGTKKATKLIPDINDGLFSFHSSISTLNTMTESIAKFDNKPDTAFILNQMLVANFLDRKNIIYHDQLKYKINALLMFPADFGGLPLANYFSHSVRGHDDPLTLWTSIYRTVSKYKHPLFIEICRMIQIKKHKQMDSYLDKKRLYEDPYCLPIKPLPSAESKIKEYTLAFLKSDYVTNKDIKRLYDKNLSIAYNDIIKTLDEMNPCYPQLCHALAKASNAGIGQRLQQKLTASKTIENATRRFSRISLIDLIQQANERFSNELRSRMDRYEPFRARDLLEGKCPYEIAETLRSTMWEKQFIGVTKPHCIHQIKLKPLDDCTDAERKKAIIIKTSHLYNINPEHFTKSFGPFKPYVGSRTREKIIKPTIDMASETSYLKGLKEIGKIKSWMELTGSENIVKFCNDLIDEKRNVVKDEVKDEDINLLFATITSGNVFHRLSTDVEHSYAMINGPLTQNSHFLQSSNNLQSITKGGEDYSIFFQLIFAYNISILSLISEFFEEAPNYFACIFCCDVCTHELPDAKFDLKTYKGFQPTSILMNTIDEVSRNEDPAVLNWLMLLHTGLLMSENIDRNFELLHGKLNLGRTSDYEKTPISINDFKRLDQKTLLLIAFTFSKHCQNILLEYNVNISRMTNDLSFSFIAELFIESNCRENLFSIMGRDVPEHTMITKKERLSAFISSKIRNFLIDNTTNIHKELFNKIFSKNNPTYQFQIGIKTLILLLEQTKFDSNRIIRAEKALRLSSFVVSKSILGCKNDIIRIDRNKIVSIWRILIKDLKPKLTEVTTLNTEILIDVKFQLTNLLTFWVNRENPGIITCKSLGFLARPLVLISSAINKYLEILMILDLVFVLRKEEGRYLYSLAEGSGGTFSGLLLVFPQLKGFYNTLMFETIDNRDCAIDTDPPACVVAGIKDRIMSDRLAIGSTDILSDQFKRKLEKCVEEYPPLIVTLDPESMDKGTNIEFLHTVTVFLNKKPLIVILKMFWEKDLDEHVNSIMGSFTEFECMFLKPTSSSPLNNEIFLCIINKSLGLHKSKNYLNIISYSKVVIEKLNNINCQSMSETDLTRFQLASSYSSKQLLELFDFNPPQLGTRRIDIHSCSLSCRRQLSLTLLLLEEFHNSHLKDSHVTVFRRGGILTQIERALCDLVFMAHIHDNRGNSLVNIIVKLNLITVNAEKIILFRKSGDRVKNPPITISLSKGNFWEKWGDSKFYLRDFEKGKACTNCNYFIIEKGENENIKNCFTWKILETLSEINIITNLHKFARFYYQN